MMSTMSVVTGRLVIKKEIILIMHDNMYEIQKMEEYTAFSVMFPFCLNQLRFLVVNNRNQL